MIYLDSNLIIYFVEKNPVWWPKIRTRLSTLRTAGEQLAVSDLARLECLVMPLSKGDAKLVSDFTAFFQDPAVRVFTLSAQVCERAAYIRAIHKYPTLDALHLAAAAEHGCSLVLTNDQRLKSFPDVPVEILV